MKTNTALKRRSLILVALLLLTISACSGMRTLSKQDIDHTIFAVERDRSRVALEEGRQAAELALEFHEQGGFERAAELFLEAADKFRAFNDRDKERRALVAAAKMQIKASHRKAFLLTMARFKGLLGRLEMLSEEECFLVNLSDHMKNKPLTYPVKASWQVIFKN